MNHHFIHLDELELGDEYLQMPERFDSLPYWNCWYQIDSVYLVSCFVTPGRTSNQLLSPSCGSIFPFRFSFAPRTLSIVSYPDQASHRLFNYQVFFGRSTWWYMLSRLIIRISLVTIIILCYIPSRVIVSIANCIFCCSSFFFNASFASPVIQWLLDFF